MWRVLAIATAIYAAGHPALDAHRPASFDRSLREFHRDVNRATSDIMQAATGVDQVRMVRQLTSLNGQFQSMLTVR